MAESLKVRQEFLRVQEQVATLSRDVETLKRANTQVIVPIQTFAPEPYELLKPLQAVVKPNDDEFEACLFDANLTALGANESEAIDNLKALILDVFEALSSRPATQLGPAPARQLAVLREFVRKRA
jgi:hypothetical protein